MSLAPSGGPAPWPHDFYQSRKPRMPRPSSTAEGSATSLQRMVTEPHSMAAFLGCPVTHLLYSIGDQGRGPEFWNTKAWGPLCRDRSRMERLEKLSWRRLNQRVRIARGGEREAGKEEEELNQSPDLLSASGC